AAAIQTLVVAIICRGRARVIGWATNLKIPARLDPAAQQLQWLFAFNSIVVAFVIIDAFLIGLTYSQWSLRMLAAFAVLIQCATFALMAEGERRSVLQRAAILMLLIGCVFVGWSFLTPGVSGTWLNRAVILMAITLATVALFGFELDK